jgi:hypothetical protein
MDWATWRTPWLLHARCAARRGRQRLARATRARWSSLREPTTRRSPIGQGAIGVSTPEQPDDERGDGVGGGGDSPTRTRGRTATNGSGEVPASKMRVRSSRMTSPRKKGKYGGDANRMGEMATALWLVVVDNGGS